MILNDLKKVQNRLMSSFIALVMLLLIQPQSSLAEFERTVVEVHGRATGRFGPYLGGNRKDDTGKPLDMDMVSGVELKEGDRAFIGVVPRETSRVNIIENNQGMPLTVGVRGATQDKTREDHGKIIYLPLEEAIVDAARRANPYFYQAFREWLKTCPYLNVGALMGAYVPADVAKRPGFDARNSDFDPNPLPSPIVGGVPNVEAGNISPDQLFLIGHNINEAELDQTTMTMGPLCLSHYLFVAPSDGTLYLGVNDSLADNNSGNGTNEVQFHVEIVPPRSSKDISMCDGRFKVSDPPPFPK